MEEQTRPQESELFGLNIDPTIKMHLAETAKWGKFLAIVGFVMCGIVILAGVFVATAVSSIDRTYSSDMPASFGRAFGSVFVFVYIILAALNFFACLFLLRFSNKMKVALAADNQTELTSSFQNLKILFRYVGVLTIVILSFYIIAILFYSLGTAIGR